MNHAKANRSTNAPQSTRRRVLDRIAIAVALCIAATLIFLTIRAKQQARDIAEQIKSNEAKLGELVTTFMQWKPAREQMPLDEAVVHDFLRSCRVAEDIPDFQGQHIISQHRGREGLAFYLPEGKHRLVISAAWPLQDAPSNQQAEPEFHEKWTLNLTGPAGYMLELTSDRHKSEPLDWKLTANDPDFEPRQETIPIGDFVGGGWSYSIDDLVVYPNQVKRAFQIKSLESAAKNPPAVKLFDIRLFGKRGTSSVSGVEISATLSSDGPARIRSSDALSILLRRRGDLLMPYQGGGKYEVRVP